MKTNKKILLFWAIILSLFLTTVVSLATIKEVRAGSLWDMQEGRTEISAKFGQSNTSPPDVRTITVNIIKVFLGFMGLIFLILIIAGGFRWMTAGGNENKIDESKSQIRSAIIGMIIIIASFMIVSFIGNRINRSLTESSDTSWYY